MNEFLLFKGQSGLSIIYDEYKNIFHYENVDADENIKFNSYGYVYINDFILFFGGGYSGDVSKSVYKYSIQNKQWTAYQNQDNASEIDFGQSMFKIVSNIVFDVPAFSPILQHYKSVVQFRFSCQVLILI
ncbi:hypothetical protein RFI_10315 [Reticulomyxa filosa]|uniref:Kelch motif family protein n=1 Tax=Reticulomyxa filosa TaxID=46433 RepID=X6NLM8_RETFI|nr:hypothetical protein RFI_10315 [Reticulomyxa filosa]|eukprot:ETO26818.1 hypothetical protein RFI_10315 [Reticulomyxa filosa]